MQLLIVMHFSDEFSEDTAEFYEYFLRVYKLPESKIHFYTLESFLRGKTVEGVLEELAGKDEPLVIYYGGHGQRNGWKLSSKYAVLYRDIVAALKNQRRPVIFLNDCCFGMALQDYLPRLSCEYLLLGLCPKTLTSYDSLVPAVVRSWRKSQPADPQKWVELRRGLTPFVLEKCASRLRFGEPLDYLCYPPHQKS